MKLVNRIYFVISVVTVIYWVITPDREISWFNTALSLILGRNVGISYSDLDDDL